MENVQTMSDLMQQIQQRIDSIKASAMQQHTKMKQSLNECIEQSIDNKLNKKRKGEGRKHRKLSEEAPQKNALSTVQQPESGSTVRLKTPADARRAFIYSEIFNRKY